MTPVAEVSATAEPEMPPNSIEVETSTMPSPPRIQPTVALASATSRRAMPPCSMISPAKMKNGIASRAKMLMPLAICWKTTAGLSPS
jgi:hypothetical protein